jgi:hypothetical protein
VKNRDVSQGAYDRSLDDVKWRVALDILAEVRRKRLELSFESSNVERLNDRQEGAACLRWSALRATTVHYLRGGRGSIPEMV